MKLKKGIPVIDQGDKLGFWGGKFGPGTGIRPVPGTGMLVAGVPGICGDGF